ncbi:cell wall-binding protein [Clostridium beijerinckii]|uniref:cell wall-binding protein n=1 Tax=Clostridium beijerinckii TaxID=1520 RepID=UPI00098BD448|nr:cell wall-binding protein [Clostridium beijerinckii]MBA8933852.1 hypothetical protein [Clostridium beijerinckii]NRU38046.1 hypothetical protein [Clostridium beijerinckii]NSA98675.1 hypothetical protein [Clostridium beijerinckii]OOM69023.1 autolysin [Clostridium beijerinckii]OOM69133.1 autolysin [Clostridium beijerinckii]
MSRKSIEKLIVKGLILVGVLAMFPIGADAEWKKDNNGWWYTEGSSWSSGWKFINNNWYYFDSNGYMKTGWVKDKNNWYYLYDSGEMAKNTSVGGYEVNADGAWIQMKENSSSSNIVNSTDVNNNNTTENIDQAVSEAIKSRGTNYLRGEAATEGHIVLDVEEKDNIAKVYTISSFGYFGFENGIFTEISGSGAIPTVMTFSKNSNGGYSLIEYKEPEDGEECENSIKQMFPKKLWDKALKGQESYSQLAESKENEAKEYLKQIGRTAEVNSRYVEKKRPNINVSAENKLFVYLGKHDSFLNDCPYWIGTKERVENGIRLIYETSQSKSADGYDVITFKETKSDGTVVEERSYKIVGNEPELQ